MGTSVKISHEDIILLNELKTHLRRRGVKVTQKQLIDESIKLAIEHEQTLVQRLTKKTDNTKELTEKFLQHAKTIDFGKHWMEEIDLQ